MKGLGIFALKTLIIAVIFSISTIYVVDACRGILVESVSGGPAFWSRLEAGLIKFADSPDLPPEKKAKIIAALRKIHDKNQPYLDALLAKE
ncbi:hypothetical protein ACVWYQ_004345 [Bradyrhizobium sp. USDA 3397]